VLPVCLSVRNISVTPEVVFMKFYTGRVLLKLVEMFRVRVQLKRYY
jgi:hypothetical protein